jgi:hypothetical protein
MTMGSDITAHRMSIGMFYARAYSSLLKIYSIFFRFGINIVFAIIVFGLNRRVKNNCRKVSNLNI